MNEKDILNFIEDKDIIPDKNWYLHATKNDIETIKKILDDGIKCAYLRGLKGNHFNGKYYISLYKNESEAEGIISWRMASPKFVIKDISPFYADISKKKFRSIFINTRIPLRTSEWEGEYQQYLKIEPSKIVALEYSLSNIIANSNADDVKEKIKFLKDMVLCVEETNKNLPIYDLSSNREFNKQKILSLHL